MSLPQHELFRSIILKFALSASKGPQRHKRLAKLYELAIQCCPERGDPNKIPFPAKQLKLSNCPIFYLTPVMGESMIPILRLSYDLTDSSKPVVGLQLILIKSQNGTQEMSAIGFRFESSHGPGMHSYCHSQRILRPGFRKVSPQYALMLKSRIISLLFALFRFTGQPSGSDR
jgi:hypothetical protein